MPHTAAYDALGRLRSFSAVGSSALLKRSQTYDWNDNGSRSLQNFYEDNAQRELRENP